MPLNIDYRQDALYQLGYQEGYKRGYHKGYQESREGAALVLLKQGMAAERVGEVTELPAERIAQLRQQAGAGR